MMPLFPRLYDLFMAPAERGRLGRWRRSLVAPAHGRVLEVGAGTGLDFAHYGPEAWVVATDPDLEMLARAMTRLADSQACILLVAADAQQLPFRDSTFDEGVVGLAMCTIPAPERALKELRRVLHPGGTLRLLEHVRMPNPVAARLQDWLTPLWRRVAAGCHLNRRTVDVVARGGFELTSIESHLGGYLLAIVARAPGASHGAAAHKRATTTSEDELSGAIRGILGHSAALPWRMRCSARS